MQITWCPAQLLRTWVWMLCMLHIHVSESLVQNENVSADKNLIILSLFTACLGHWQSQSKTKTHDDVMCRCSINTDIVASHTFKVWSADHLFKILQKLQKWNSRLVLCIHLCWIQATNHFQKPKVYFPFKMKIKREKKDAITLYNTRETLYIDITYVGAF